MDFRSGVLVYAGFVFWLVLAYFFYNRNFMGIAILSVIAVAGMAGWGIYSCVQRALDRRSSPSPKSDLPADFNFKDVEPSDFE